MQNLQQMLDKKTEDFDRVMTLFSAFQHGSDELATNLLARLRIGESIESLVQELETQQMSVTGYVCHLVRQLFARMHDPSFSFPKSGSVDIEQ